MKTVTKRRAVSLMRATILRAAVPALAHAGFMALCLAVLSTSSLPAIAQNNTLHFVIRNEPKTFNPVLVEDDASETVRYLTGGVLIRLNRATQQLEPALASSWKVSPDGRAITFKLRPDIKFSDGTPFSADDVAYTFHQMMDPSVHSPTGDAFRSASGAVTAKVANKDQVTITFPALVAGMPRLFDSVAIMSAKSPNKEKAVLGPYVIAEYKPGSYLQLARNPNYWKKDAQGRRLPLIDAIRLDIQQNRDTEALRFQRGELDLINSLDPDYFTRLQKIAPRSVVDLGPSLDAEQFWFNQVVKSPVPAYKIAWFRSQNFRLAIAHAINREDIARLVFGGHARPSVGAVSVANKFWFNEKLKPYTFDRRLAMELLAKDGFHRDGATLRDHAGNAVEFSIVTNAGNKARERESVLIQQDLSELGIKVNIVTLDFPSLIDRITQSFNYEACILGLLNSDLDPNEQMNVWLSSSENHQWDPSQKSPATPWEAEIDKLMREQASSPDPKVRKRDYDRVQQIVWDEVPFLYLVTRDALAAISPHVKNVQPSVLRPQTYWNVDSMSIEGKK